GRRGTGAASAGAGVRPLPLLLPPRRRGNSSESLAGMSSVASEMRRPRSDTTSSNRGVTLTSLFSPFPARGEGGRGVRVLPPRLLLLGVGTLLQTIGATLAALTVASLPLWLLPLAALLFALGILCLAVALFRQ